MPCSYPEVDVEVPGAPKLPVTDLEGHRHLVTLVKRLVEAFAAVGGQGDVVGASSLEESCAGEQQLPGGGEEHRGGLRGGLWSVEYGDFDRLNAGDAMAELDRCLGQWVSSCRGMMEAHMYREAGQASS